MLPAWARQEFIASNIDADERGLASTTLYSGYIPRPRQPRQGIRFSELRYMQAEMHQWSTTRTACCEACISHHLNFSQIRYRVQNHQDGTCFTLECTAVIRSLGRTLGKWHGITRHLACKRVPAAGAKPQRLPRVKLDRHPVQERSDAVR